MSKTVEVTTKMTDINVLVKVFQRLYKWKDMQVVTPEQESKGEGLETKMYDQRRNDAVLVVRRDNLTDEKGRKALYSDLAVVRQKDGTLAIMVDVHNFQGVSGPSWLDQHRNEIHAQEYAKEDIAENDANIGLHVESTTGWQQTADGGWEETLEISEEELHRLGEQEQQQY